MQEKNLLTIKEVMNKVRLSRSRIYFYIKNNNFPKQVKLTTRKSLWVEEEINQWILKKIDKRDFSLHQKK